MKDTEEDVLEAWLTKITGYSHWHVAKMRRTACNSGL
jgi:hypothetical protein